ncbi:uncharacterized protein LOC143925664 [Lithobates pipiens]
MNLRLGLEQLSFKAIFVKELTKPAISSASMFGGQQNSSFPTASSSASSAPQSASSFSFKPDSQAPSAGPISSFPTASGFANKPAISFSNAVMGSAASFSAATALPASTPSPVTGAFGETTSASGFGQSTTSGFGGTTSASGFGQSTTSGFGETTAASGFGQSATSVFGGGPSTSGFGGPAANTVTSGLGSKTSAVSDLFKAGAASSATTSLFGQASGVSVSRPPSVTSTSEASSKNPVCTPRSELSDKELSQFVSKRFSLENIPTCPPPADPSKVAKQACLLQGLFPVFPLPQDLPTNQQSVLAMQ